jgi:hypothetical protein
VMASHPVIVETCFCFEGARLQARRNVGDMSASAAEGLRFSDFARRSPSEAKAAHRAASIGAPEGAPLQNRSCRLIS